MVMTRAGDELLILKPVRIRRSSWRISRPRGWDWERLTGGERAREQLSLFLRPAEEGRIAITRRTGRER